MHKILPNSIENHYKDKLNNFIIEGKLFIRFVLKVKANIETPPVKQSVLWWYKT